MQFGITSDFIFPYRRLQKLTTITLTELCSWHYCFFLSLTSKNTKLYLTVSSTEFLLFYFQFPEHYSTRSEKKRQHVLLFRTQWWKRVFFILSVVLIFFPFLDNCHSDSNVFRLQLWFVLNQSCQRTKMCFVFFLSAAFCLKLVDNNT